MAAGAQALPAGWSTHKERKGVCQISLPADWKPGAIPTMIEDAKKKVTLVLVQEESYTVKPMSDAELKMHKAVKVVENSSKRVFIEEEPSTLAGTTTTAWNAWAPAPKGSCHAWLTLKKDADLETARKVIDSLQAAR